MSSRVLSFEKEKLGFFSPRNRSITCSSFSSSDRSCVIDGYEPMVQNFQGSLMEYQKSFNGSMMPVETRHPGRLTMEAPIANRYIQPQVDEIKFPGHQVQNQGVESNWKEEPAIEYLRRVVKHRIEGVLHDSKIKEHKRDIIATCLEKIRFREATSKEEYMDRNNNSLKPWILMRLKSLLHNLNGQLGVARRNMQITDEATRSFQSFPNHCSPVGLSNYQQQDLDPLYHQHSTQGMVSHSSLNGQLAAGGTRGRGISQNSYQQFQQQPTLVHFNRNGELATNGSAAYIDESEVASGGTMNYYGPTDCLIHQQQDLDQQTHETLKHFSHCQDSFHSYEVVEKIGGPFTSNPDFFRPQRGTRRTRYDRDVGQNTGMLEDIVASCKRPRIDDPYAPLFVGYETYQECAPIDLPLSPQVQQMHQQPLDNRSNPLLYGYGTPEWAPVSLPLSPQGLPQMHQGYTSEVIEETLEHRKIDYPSVPEYETCQSWAPTLSSQGLLKMHQHPYVPLSDGSNVTELNVELFGSCTQDSPKSIGNEDTNDSIELKLDCESIISEELIDSSADEDIVQNIFNQVKTEAEHIPAVDHVASSTSETSNKNIIHSVELFTLEKIKEPVMNCIQDSKTFSEVKLGHPEDSPQQKPYADIVTSEEELMISSNQELFIVETPIVQAQPEVVEPKPDKSKIIGASFTELFTPEQIKEHVKSLRQWFGESKAKAEKKRAADHVEENACSMCAVVDLSFEAPRCSLCGFHFKQNDKYYTALEGDANYFFCTACYNGTKEEKITVGGLHITKARLEKSKKSEIIVEPWVQCDKCKSWQHQICALFNSKRNVEDNAEYKCPNCYIQEIEIGQRMPLPQSTIPGAKDLKRTKLSDFIEGRLFSSLKQERKDRARSMGKNFNEVPGVEDIVVRVVLSADKTLQVKQNFLGVFKEENYPKQFPYRSKVILLFQKIEGAEVCLFGMYVQEFGSDSAPPNHRSIYISYLDSVKFLRPDIKLASGETLRTFVYHEILVGYLDYCKKRGFTRCYIWSCPPSKGDDYIFYCHPEIKKRLKSEHLREWYRAMLRKATSENIVVNVTNLYEDFFVPHDECKVTATRLPYFDGDYWPRSAEDLLKNLVVEDGVKPRRKKPKSRRSPETIEHTDLSGTSVTDIQLMQELGKTIFKTKENFIVVKLESEHMPLDTEDNDELIETKIFENRETFLHFCETNHYQFDTLRRAKYSTMMLLYHLHNPSG